MGKRRNFSTKKEHHLPKHLASVTRAMEILRLVIRMPLKRGLTDYSDNWQISWSDINVREIGNALLFLKRDECSVEYKR